MSEYDRQSAELTKSILSLPEELKSKLLSGMSWDEIKKLIPGSVETALALGTGAYGNIAGGWANIAGAALPGPPGQGNDWQQRTQDMLTYQPADARVPKLLDVVAAPDELTRKVGETFRDATDKYGPGVSTAAETAPVLLASVLGARTPGRSKRRVGTTGQYVGAPPGVDSPQKLGAIVKTYKDAMEAGFPGRNFYNDSSADIWARTGQDIAAADPVVRNLAILSRSNNVGGNTTMSTKGHVQAVTGQPVETGRFPSRDSGPVAEAYSAGPDFAGLKREPFAEQLSVAWAPERIARGVNDMHEAELMGYPGKATLGSTHHAFMDEVRARAIEQANRETLGGVADWNTGTAQAAAWTGNKIRRGEVTPGDAAKSYADYLPRMEANATYESFPGVGTGHLPNAPAENFAAKQVFHDDPAGAWATSPSGRDVGYTAARLLPGEDVAAVGRFNDEVNPATVARPVVSQMTTPEGPRMLPSAKDALNLVEGSRAYADAQNAGAWHKIYDSKADDYTGAKLHVPGMSEAKMKELAPIFEKKGYYIGSSPEGIAIIANENTAKGKAFSAEVRQLLKDAGHKNPRLEFGALESGYVDYSGGWKAGEGSGAVTSQLLDLVDKAPATAKLLEASDPYRSAFAARNERDMAAQARGWGAPRADVMRAREIFKAEGWDGLRAAVKKGLVPMAAALTIGGGSQLLDGYEPPTQ